MRDIIVKESQGKYTAYVRAENGDLLWVTVPEPPSMESRWLNWARWLDPTELEVVTRVTYDRWAWETGSEKDARLLRILEEEKEWRIGVNKTVYDDNGLIRAFQDNYDDHV